MMRIPRVLGPAGAIVLSASVGGSLPSARGQAAPATPTAVDFGRYIQPILAASCLRCHGPRKTEGDLRLDTREGLHKGGDSGAVVISGDGKGSLLYQLLVATDPDKRMPRRRRPLAPAQIETMRRWIDQGAPWPEGAVVQALSPAPEDRAARPAGAAAGLSFNRDVRPILAENCYACHGPDRNRRQKELPLDPEEVRAFLEDTSPNAYERQVDRLLASPRFGERMGVYWLDLVRYADSAGYHSDNPRTVWPYRDYVIGAFNRNLPFDQFTAVQLAGDLLPDASPEQRIASGYNRLLQTTEEGGAQPKEYRAIYLADRVRNASAVWLGGTLGCAQCHDHKFDPFLARDFYGFAAFFADVQE